MSSLIHINTGTYENEPHITRSIWLNFNKKAINIHVGTILPASWGAISWIVPIKLTDIKNRFVGMECEYCF